MLRIIPGPGALLIIRNPPQVDSYIGNSEGIMLYSKPLIVIHDNLAMNEVHPNANSNMSGALLHGLRVECMNISTEDCSCRGSMCDKQAMLVNGKVKQKCACFTNNARNSNYVMALDLKMTKMGIDPIKIKEFGSQHFLGEYMTEGRLPPGNGARTFSNMIVEDLLDEGVTSVFDYVNGNGGWTAIMWCKQGRVLDNAANPEGPSSHMAEKIWKPSGHVMYHLVSLKPSEPMNINPVRMKSLKVNLSELSCLA